MPMSKPHFYTLKGYDILELKRVTYAMEDYLEMICRICLVKKVTRVSELAALLNVKPSSVTKMASRLKQENLVEFERYGLIRLTKKGRQLGEYLIFRHEVVHRFLCQLNQSKEELELTEKIEHYLDQRTVQNMARWLLDREKSCEIKKSKL